MFVRQLANCRDSECLVAGGGWEEAWGERGVVMRAALLAVGTNQGGSGVG